VKNGKTVAIAGAITDVTEKMAVEEGLAEAEFLIKDVSGDKKVSEYRSRVASPQTKGGRLGYFRSLFSRSSDEDEEEDVFADVPTNLR
jgi:hypothetical protein